MGRVLAFSAVHRESSRRMKQALERERVTCRRSRSASESARTCSPTNKRAPALDALELARTCSSCSHTCLSRARRAVRSSAVPVCASSATSRPTRLAVDDDRLRWMSNGCDGLYGRLGGQYDAEEPVRRLRRPPCSSRSPSHGQPRMFARAAAVSLTFGPACCICLAVAVLPPPARQA